MRSAFEGEGGNSVTTEFMLLLGIGFVAQLVDGALGMAYGVLSNAAMLTMGLQPAQASCASPYRGDFHHGRLGGFAYLSSQCGRYPANANTTD
jgi:hypothetical protein